MEPQGEQHAEEIGVFEVFKMGHLSPADVAALSQEELRSRYSLLVPVSDHAQLQSAPAGFQLATLPQPGHMVVDKSHFQAMMARELTRVVQAKRDEPLFKAHDAFAQDRQMVSSLLRDTLAVQRERLQALVDGLRDNGEKAELLAALRDFIAEDQKLWGTISSHPFFRGDEEHEEEEQQQEQDEEQQQHGAAHNGGAD